MIVVEATFMQYLCGPEVDAMRVDSVNLAKYKYLIGEDIDPQVFPSAEVSELKGYFYDNHSDQYGLTYRLKGRLSKFNAFGCGNSTAKFWVEEIEMLDGSKKMTNKEIAAYLHDE